MESKRPSFFGRAAVLRFHKDDYAHRIHVRRLRLVVDTLDSVLTPSERKEFVGFIEVSEYGIALDVLSDILVQARREIPRVALEEMSELAEKTGIHASFVTPDLTDWVRDE